MSAGSGTRPTLCLIDGNSYIHRAFHAIRELRNSRGIPTNAVHGFLAMLVKVLREVHPDLVAVAFDAGGATFRHDLFPAYKANRPPMPDDLAVQVDYIHRLTAAFGVRVVARRGVEADDLLAILSRRAVRDGYDVVLITGDKDLQQLLDEHTTILDTMKDRQVTAESFRRDHGYDPARFADVQALGGDPGDNLPGVPGIGPKTAEKLVREFGTLKNILGHLDAIPPRTAEMLRSHRRDAELSLELVTLRDDLPLEMSWKELESSAPDGPVLKQLLTELELKRFIRELDLGADETTIEFVLREDGNEAWLRGVAGGGPLTVALAGEKNGAAVLALTLDGTEIRAFTLDPARPPEQAVLDVLADPAVAKRGYDLKGVMRSLSLRGISFRGLEMDVLLAGYLLDPSEKGTSLGELAVAWLGHSSAVRGEGERQGSLFVAVDVLRQQVARDAAVAHRLAGRLETELERSGMLGLYREVELPLVPILAGMETAGIRLDSAALRELSKEMDMMLLESERRIHLLAGGPFNLGSPKQLAEVLFTRLGLPPLKKIKTGYSTDEEVLTQLAAMHELPALLIAHRQMAKLKNTYVDVLPKMVGGDGRLHTTFNQAVTATGRLSSSDPNLQNIPIRSEWGGRIRRAFIPEPGWRFVAADYSQIELRVLAHLSGDETLVEAFRSGEDVHAATAMAIFHVAAEGVTKEMRRAAKVINFGIIYGMSPFGLARELGVDQKEAKRRIDDYFTVYPGVRTYLDGLVAGAKRDGYVTTLLGRRRQLKEFQSGKPQLVQFAERAALNTPIQGTAADIIKLAMIRLDRELAGSGTGARLLLQIHDELLLECPAGEVDAAARLLRECMEGVVSFRVPVVVDVAIGDSWGDLH